MNPEDKALGEEIARRTDAFLRESLREMDEENPNWREDLAKREEADRQEAAVALHDALVEAGARPGTVDMLMPYLLQVFNPRLDRVTGVLEGGMLYSAYPAMWEHPPASWWKPEPHSRLVLQQSWQHAVHSADDESTNGTKPGYSDGERTSDDK
jgi:hypothetical protein